MLNILYTIIIYPLTQIIEFSFMLSLNIFKNTGVAVLGVSFAVSILCLPLYIVAEAWSETERKKVASLARGVSRIKATFTGDEQYMILSTFYKQNNYSTFMALRSSFGLLIQIPFFIAAYHFLSHCPQLTGKHFLFIRDMGAADSLFKVGAFTVNVLPILMTAVNLVSGVIYSKGHALREKVQIFVMAALFLVILYKSPAGLVVYWLTNNVFSLVKNIFYRLKHPAKVLYALVVAAVILLDFYVLVIHNGPIHKRVLLAFCASLLLAVPLLVRAARYLLNTILQPLIERSGERNLLFLCDAFVMFFLVGLVIPTLTIKSSVVEFTAIDGFSISHFITQGALQAAGIFLFWAVCVYFLFNKNIQSIFSLLMTALVFVSLTNAFIFYGSYPTLSRVLTFASSLEKPRLMMSVINLLALLIIALVPLGFFIIGKRFAIFLKAPFTIVAIILMGEFLISTINVAQITSEEKTLLSKTVNTTNGTPDNNFRAIYHFSKTQKNIVLLMLDRAESAYLIDIFKEYPEIAKAFSGFTYYPNCASFNQGTLLAAPALFGGYEYTPLMMNKRKNEPLVEKHNEALKVLPTLFYNNGYKATVSDLSWANYQWIPDLSIFNGTGVATYNTELMYRDDWIASHPNCVKKGATAKSLERNILWFSFFKIAPMLARDSIYRDGAYWASDGAANDIMEFLGFYSALDYLSDITDFSATGPTYFTIVNDTAHSNVTLKAPNYTPDNSDATDSTNKNGTPKNHSAISNYKAIGVNVAVLRLTAKWLNYLKANGVYNNTRIVVVSDHGNGNKDGERIHFYNNNGGSAIEKRKYLGDHNNPLLLFKDFGADGALNVDDTFMTNADVPALLTKDVIKDAKNPFTNNSIKDSSTYDNGEKVARGVVLTHNWRPGGNGPNTFAIPMDDLYDIKRSIFDYSNWTPSDLSQ